MASENKTPKQLDDAFRKEIEGFIAEFKGESERAAVILGAAKLDALLYQLLAKVLLPSVGNQDELLDGDSPLSSFSARINLSFRLGLIDAKFARALHLIRKIRNSFAHEVSGASLTTGAHRDRIRELCLPLVENEIFAKTRDQVFGASGPAADFRMALSITMIRLEAAIHYADEINTRPFSLTPRAWAEKVESEVE